MIPLLFEPTRPPRQHQWKALEKARGRKGFGFFMEMGTGKSKTLLDEICQLYMEGIIDRAIIFAGAGSYADWTEKHIRENVPPAIPHASHLWSGGGTKTERDTFNRMMTRENTLLFLVMNIEAISSPNSPAQTVAMNFVKSGKAMIAVDESTKIKKFDAQRTMQATWLGKQAVVRRAMSGSAVTKSPLDLWGQVVFLGIEENFAQNFYAFRARFCTLKKISTGLGKPGPNGAPAKMKTTMLVTGYQNLDRLEKLLAQHSFRVLKEECLELPPKIYQVERVELTKEQKQAYVEMKKLATTEIKSGVWATAKNAMGRLQKMHRITLGHLVDEDGNVHRLPTNRPERLCELVEETDLNKVIIWCAYTEDVEIVLEALAARFPDRKAYHYYGKTDNEMRAEAKQEFEFGDASFLVGTAATGGYGLTLISSKNTIYYSNTFSLEHRLQSEDRNHRDGQKFAVTYVDMIATGTVEERIVKVLRSNKDMADTVMGDGVREWLEWMND